MIVFHHISVPEDASLYSWEEAGWLRGYLQFGLAKTATALLSVISGLLLWSKPFEREPAKLLKQKARTLLLPLLLCNLPIAVALALGGHLGVELDERASALAAGDATTWLNSLLGVTEHPVNQALHFLRDLLVCNILALVIAPLFRRQPVLTFVLAAAFFLFDLDGLLVRRDDIFIFFLLGGLLGHLRAELTALDRLAKPLMLGWLLFALGLYVTGRWEDPLLMMLNRALAVVALWSGLSYLEASSNRDRLAKGAKYAFFIFLVHMPVDFVLYKGWMSALGRDRYPSYWLLSPVIVLATAILLFEIMRLTTPRLLAMLTGGRTKKAEPRPAGVSRLAIEPTSLPSREGSL